MRSVIEYLQRSYVLTPAEGELVGRAFNAIPYTEFITYTREQVAGLLRSSEDSTRVDTTQLTQKLLVGIVDATIVALHMQHFTGSDLVGLRKLTYNIGPAEVLILDASSFPALAILQDGLRTDQAIIEMVALNKRLAANPPQTRSEHDYPAPHLFPLNSSSVRTFRAGGPGGHATIL